MKLSNYERKRIEHKLNIATQIYKTSKSATERKEAYKKIKKYSDQLKDNYIKVKKINESKPKDITMLTPDKLLECMQKGMKLKDIASLYNVTYPTLQAMRKRFIQVEYSLKEVKSD